MRSCRRQEGGVGWGGGGGGREPRRRGGLTSRLGVIVAREGADRPVLRAQHSDKAWYCSRCRPGHAGTAAACRGGACSRGQACCLALHMPLPLRLACPTGLVSAAAVCQPCHSPCLSYSSHAPLSLPRPAPTCLARSSSSLIWLLTSTPFSSATCRTCRQRNSGTPREPAEKPVALGLFATVS